MAMRIMRRIRAGVWQESKLRSPAWLGNIWLFLVRLSCAYCLERCCEGPVVLGAAARGLGHGLVTGRPFASILFFSNLLVFAEAETAKPPGEIHGRASHGLTG